MELDAETTFWAVFAFIFGTLIGSFLNVVIYRLPRRPPKEGEEGERETLSSPPSHCPACKHRLHIWPDMVPIFSQLLSWSRCRYCAARFSWRYLWVEVITGALFAGVVVAFWDHPWQIVPNLVFISALIAIAFIDLEHFEIPDALVLVAIGAGVVKDILMISTGDEKRVLWQAPDWIPGIHASLPVPVSIFGAVICFWMLWQLAALASAAVKEEAIGAGDATLLAAMGANLWPLGRVGIAFMVAVLFGAVAGLAQLAAAEWRRHLARGSSGPPPGALVTATSDGQTAAISAGTLESEPIPPLDEPPTPLLPRESRSGRVLTVAGTWAVAFGLWWVAARWSQGQVPVALAGGLMAFTVAAALIRVGSRLWRAGDEVWAPAADEAFEAGPGPRVIPFGPWLVVGTLVAMFFGQDIVEAYLAYLGYAAG